MVFPIHDEELTRVKLNAPNVLTTASLVGLGVGFWMAWQPLGLIVPCGIVFGLLCWGQMRR